MREKPLQNQYLKVPYRITPACAGKTVDMIPERYFYGDHPRVCGKNRYVCVHYSKSIGSPPRVREKLQGKKTLNVMNGITPACAGKTVIQMFQKLPLQDHPRVCGKNFGSSAIASKVPGSPPRVREKRFEKNQNYYDCRITPACAGKTQGLGFQTFSRQDHPRVCGKN